jgi:hypothetical protein
LLTCNHGDPSFPTIALNDGYRNLAEPLVK